MVKKKTKLESLQGYFSRSGYRLEQLKQTVKGKVKYSYRLIATHPLGHIKRGEVVTEASTLAPFERFQRTRFLERRVPKEAAQRAKRVAPKSRVRITPKRPKLRR